MALAPAHAGAPPPSAVAARACVLPFRSSSLRLRVLTPRARRAGRGVRVRHRRGAAAAAARGRGGPALGRGERARGRRGVVVLHARGGAPAGSLRAAAAVAAAAAAGATRLLLRGFAPPFVARRRDSRAFCLTRRCVAGGPGRRRVGGGLRAAQRQRGGRDGIQAALRRRDGETARRGAAHCCQTGTSTGERLRCRPRRAAQPRIWAHAIKTLGQWGNARASSRFVSFVFLLSERARYSVSRVKPCAAPPARRAMRRRSAGA